MKRFLRIAAFSALLICFTGCTRGPNTNLPSVDLPGLDGQPWHLHDEVDQIVILHFFASFDNSSIALATILERLHIQYREQNVRVIGVAMDAPDSHRRTEIVEAFCALNNLTFDVVLSTEELGEGATDIGQIPTIPATVIFDRRGTPVASSTGFFTFAEIEGVIDELLENNGIAPQPVNR